ncbi:SDR family NAD(P)-dependent oxidoreductase [Nocardioides zhouii]|uniref:Probable oxidoreductase n=1 Tax=Nocardioides zhouii TaxID=1168729 RepID=A0A4V1RR12_9ACTN|nr:SDR family NAD(P)-dependent oxidoreductase [Nocardioides zhouii]RYC14747.1 SDR family NAD(P)-dependent oxidoreductase [Nocardioides zhouii]
MTTCITTPFDATSTAAEVVAGLDLTGRRALVTGGAAGIGLETARALAGAGAQVTLAVRDVGAGRTAARDIATSTGNDAVALGHLDLADLGSVEALVAAWDEPLHILVNNAGIMASPEAYTPQGWELQFATNHLGHFALALGLHEALAAAEDARVVSVSSSGHGNAPVDFDDLFFDRRPYDAGTAYGQSKTANVLFAVEAHRRWSGDGITTNALMPGGVWTGLQQHWDPKTLAATKAQVPATDASGMGVKTPQQGAATSVLLATWPGVQGVGGGYFEDCHEAEVVDQIPDGLHGVCAYALDPLAAERLWDVSASLVANAH